MAPSTTSGGAAPVPERVRLFAAQHSLGRAMDVRSERSTASMVGIGLAVFAVGLVGSLLLGAYNAAQDAARYSGNGGTHHTFFAPFGALVVIGLVLAVRGVLIGTRMHYLYSGGLIHRRRRGMQKIAWPEITEVCAVYGRERGDITGYRVTGAGHSILVPLACGADGRDAFIDELLGFAQQHDRPIH